MQSSEGEQFPSTDWPLIARASASGNGQQAACLTELLELYAPALRRYLLSQKRIAVDDVDDIVQDFITAKFLERPLVEHAKKIRGRFRNLLVRALENFLIDRSRRQKACGRSPSNGEVLQLDHDAPDSASSNGDPARAFDLAWAQSVLHAALEMTREHCERKGRQKQWLVFSARMLADSSQPPSYQELIARFEIKNPIEAGTAMITCKRLFERSLRKVVSSFEPLDDAAFAEEVRELKQILAGGRAGL